MKIIFLLCIVFLLFISSCNSGDKLVDANKSMLYYYTKSKKEVVYKYDETLTGIKMWTRRKKIETDASSFIVLAKFYAKDNRGGFYKEKKFEADGKTLQYISDNYCKDKNHLYYCGGIVENVDVSSLKIDNYLIRDKYNVFKGKPQYDKNKSRYYLSIIEGANSNDYQRISAVWAKDESSYFCFDKKINVDTVTFNIIEGNTAVDKSYLYYPIAGEVKIYKRNGKLHTLIDNIYYDDNTIYNFRKYPISTIEIENPETIKLVDTTSQIVFFVDNILYWNLSRCDSSHIDIESFQIIQNNKDYATDSEHIYYRGSDILGADVSTFVLLSHAFSKDKNSVFHRDRILEGADPNSFEYISAKNAKDYCKDKNHKWECQNGKWIMLKN